MRLLRVVLMTLAVLSLTLLPVGAAVHRHVDSRTRGAATTHVAVGAAVVHHHHEGASVRQSTSHHRCPSPHDGKCCGLACCGPNACGTVASLMVTRLHRPEPPVPVRDDARRDGAASGLSLRPPIAA